MSWTGCMKDKIEHKYGEQAVTCVEGMSSGDIEKIAKCIAGVIGDADPVAIAAELTEWSLECAL